MKIKTELKNWPTLFGNDSPPFEFEFMLHITCNQFITFCYGV